MSTQLRQVPFAWVQTFSDQDRWTLATFLVVFSLLIVGFCIKRFGDNAGWWPDPCCPCCAAIEESLRERGILKRQSPLYVAPEIIVQSEPAPAPIRIGEMSDIADVIRSRKEAKEAAKSGVGKYGVAQTNSTAQKIRDYHEGRGPESEGAGTHALATANDTERGQRSGLSPAASPRLGPASPTMGSPGAAGVAGKHGPISPRTPGGRRRLGVSPWEGPASPSAATSRRPSLADREGPISPSAAASRRASLADKEGLISPSAATSRRPSAVDREGLVSPNRRPAVSAWESPASPSAATSRRPSLADREGPISPSASGSRRPSASSNAGPRTPTLGGQKQAALASPLSPGAQQRRNRWKTGGDAAGMAAMLEEEAPKPSKTATTPRTPAMQARSPVTGRRSAWADPL